MSENKEQPKVDVANEPVEEDEEMFDSGVLHEKRDQDK